MQKFAKLLQPPCGNQDHFPTLGVVDDGSPGLEVLLIGLGGGTLAQYLQGNCRNLMRLVGVEVDPRVVRVAQLFFGFNFKLVSNMADTDSLMT